ncbi:SCO6745 family protein [Pseudonocardia spinosispora]|uniref:SCO6745 family protein n=1 Tax=Pseudonocardia spinosispora TaxID=103441 RepID=UPI00040D2089|nr:hypothetical protein [Pseudonocardia spinosispora]
MSDASTVDAVRAAGGPIEEIGALFMLHPETFEQSAAKGYPHPFAGYFAGRGGVLGEADASTVSAVFAVFEPNAVKMFWEQGVAVHGAAGGASVYNEQIADFARKHLTGAEGLDRLAELGQKVVDAAPISGLPLFAGWAPMPVAEDAEARALQVLFKLRELRGSIHMNALALSGLSPIEAHMLNKGTEYCSMFGWSEPFADGEDKRDAKQAAEDATNRRMADIVGAALTADEAAELATLSAGALAVAKASASPQA